jgi:hypothetical protein
MKARVLLCTRNTIHLDTESAANELPQIQAGKVYEVTFSELEEAKPEPVVEEKPFRAAVVTTKDPWA